MKNEDLTTSASLTLKNFMSETHSWESIFFKLRKEQLKHGDDDDSVKTLHKEKLEKILEKFAFKDKLNFGRLIDMGCTNPPTYDPKQDTLKILSEKDDTVVIQSQQNTGLEATSKFTLILKNNKWMIQKKEILDHNDKWKKSNL